VLPREAHCTYRAPINVETRRRLTVALVITAIVMLVELIGGWLAGSLALLADAAHMLADGRGPRPGARRRVDRATAGDARALVSGSCGWRFSRRSSTVRCCSPSRSASGRGVAPAAGAAARERTLAAGVAAVGFGREISLRSVVLHRGHEHSLNTTGRVPARGGRSPRFRGRAHRGRPRAHVRLGDGRSVDFSLLIGGLVLVSAWRLVKESTDVLLEATPRHIALSDVHEAHRVGAGSRIGSRLASVDRDERGGRR